MKSATMKAATRKPISHFNAITIEIITILASLSLAQHAPASHCLHIPYKRTKYV
jgi:hypothetical protein